MSDEQDPGDFIISSMDFLTIPDPCKAEESFSLFIPINDLNPEHHLASVAFILSKSPEIKTQPVTLPRSCYVFVTAVSNGLWKHLNICIMHHMKKKNDDQQLPIGEKNFACIKCYVETLIDPVCW